MSETDRRFCRIVVVVALGLLVSSCTSVQSTPIQEYVWQMGHNCEHVNSDWQLVRVEADGRYFIRGSNATSSGNFQQCMQEQYQRYPYKKWLADNSTQIAPAQGATSPSTAPVNVASATGTSRGLPTWKAGDEWEYRWQSPRGKGTFVWAVKGEQDVDGVTYYVVAAGTAREIYYRKSDFAYFMDKLNGQVELRHTPATAYLPWPPWPGTKVEATYTRERPIERQTEQVTTVCESGPAESVTVPAGTFEAVKVTCHDGRSGAMTMEMWVSEAVKNFVRQRVYFSYGVRERELTRFKLR